MSVFLYKWWHAGVRLTCCTSLFWGVNLPGIVLCVIITVALRYKGKEKTSASDLYLHSLGLPPT